MTIAKLEFYMKRADVDLDEITEEGDKKLINNAIELCEQNKHEEAASILMSILDFECAWGNMDCDPSEHLAATDDILIKCSSDNTQIRVGSDEGDFVISAAIHFDIEVKDLNEPEELFDWLDDNSGWACCAFSPGGDWESGWAYTASDGDNLYVIEWDGSPVD